MNIKVAAFTVSEKSNYISQNCRLHSQNLPCIQNCRLHSQNLPCICRMNFELAHKGWVFAWRAVFPYAHAPKLTVSRWSHKLYARADQARYPLYLNKPYIALLNRFGRCTVTFWLTSLTWFIFALLSRKFHTSQISHRVKNWYQYVDFGKCEICVWSISIILGV